MKCNSCFDEMKPIYHSSGLMRALVLFSMLFSALVATAQTSTNQIRKLSLNECIVIALEHNFDVQIVRYDPEISRFNLASIYGAYDPVFSFSGQHDYQLSQGGIDSQGRVFAGTEMNGDSFNTGLSGLLPWGLNYNLGGNISDRYGNKPGATTDFSSPTGFSTNYFTDGGGNPVTLVTTNYGSTPLRVPFENTTGQAAALQLSQPLLKGFLIDSVRYNIYVAKANVKISEESFRSQLMSTITDVETAYYRLVYAEDFVTVQEKALELANRLVAENQKRVEVGAMAPLDEQQAASQAATSQAALLAAQASRDTAQRALKSLLSDSYTNTWAGVLVAPTDRLLAVPQIYDLQESWRKGMAQNPALVQARLNATISKYNLRYRRNQLLPEVNVVGSYGYSGSSKEYSGVFDQVGSGDYPFWTVGGQLTVPLSRTAERNNYKAAKAERERQELIVKRSEQGVLITIENSIGTAKADFEQVEATRQARLYAEAALEAAQKKLENGKSTTFEVLQLQKDLTSARADEINALANYNIDLARLALAEGSTLERRHVDLNIGTLKTAVFPSYQP